MEGIRASAAYEGTIMHARYGEVSHHFTYPLFMMYIDLSELDSLDRLHPLWSFSGKKNWFFFHRKDYLDQKEQTLIESIKELLVRKGFSTLAAKMTHVNMLTHMRYMGYCYNPVTFYLVYSDKKNERPDFIVADINNTPWNERYPYVLEVSQEAIKPLSFNFKKDFHISPFYPMNLDYAWVFDFNHETIHIQMDSFLDNKLCFKANLKLNRVELNARVMTKLLLKYPCVTLKTMTAIYWQAFKLFLKKSRFYTHPAKEKEVS
jgi:DUF1365 family protein